MAGADAEIVKRGTNSSGAAVRLLEVADRLILRGWRLFTSLKFGILLLVCIAAASIYGTMGFAANPALGDNAIPMARRLVFENKWFVGLLLLFATNLILSTWHVTVMSFTIWWKREFRRDPDYYKHGGSPRAEVPVPGGIEEVESVLRRNFSRVHRDGNAFFAHKGILSRLGPTIVHIGILTVIGAVVAKAFLLWNGGIMTEGRFIAAEGEVSNIVLEPVALEQQITDRNNRPHALDVWIRVLDFDEIKHPNSDVPAYFSSLVEVLDPHTQQVTVAQLDMNHHLKVPSRQYGSLEFHQAGYQRVPDGEVQRVNFDVRDRTTGERIAVTDAHAHNRVRIGDTQYFLEVDGVQPADRWAVYTAKNPLEAVASGLLAGGQKIKYTFKLEEFFPDLAIDEKAGKPYNATADLNNPALRATILLDDRPVETTYLFYHEGMANLLPDSHPRFRLRLTDIKVPREADLASHEWNKPGSALFEIQLIDKSTGKDIGSELLRISETSSPREYTSTVDHAGVALGTEGNFDVRIIGPTQRFVTILSVVNEPTVRWINIGVGILVAGALLTFLFRYRAFYGLWDEEHGALRMALVPRWGQSPVREEFDDLVATLSHGAGPLLRGVMDKATEEVAPAHGSAQLQNADAKAGS